MTKRSAEELRAALDQHIAALDRHGAVESVLDAVHDGSMSVTDLYEHVLSPLLVDLGRAWERGTERVWQEHYASHVIRTVIEALYLDVHAEAAAAPSKGVTVVLACPPKEQHVLGLRMLADRFELGGYDTVFLGADTPVEEIIAAVRATNAELVALSVSTTYERVAFRAFIEQMRSALAGVRIVVGGPAFRRDEHWPAEDFLSTADLDLPGSPKVG